MFHLSHLVQPVMQCEMLSIKSFLPTPSDCQEIRIPCAEHDGAQLSHRAVGRQFSSVTFSYSRSGFVQVVVASAKFSLADYLEDHTHNRLIIVVFRFERHFRLSRSDFTIHCSSPERYTRNVRGPPARIVFAYLW